MSVVARTYSRESLADEVGCSPRTISHLVNQGLIPPAHGYGRWSYYDDTHVRAFRAYQAVRDNNTRLSDLSTYLREEGISLVDYVRQRGLSLAS
jgi:DNA-binding transcriptional MerR regulator